MLWTGTSLISWYDLSCIEIRTWNKNKFSVKIVVAKLIHLVGLLSYYMYTSCAMNFCIHFSLNIKSHPKFVIYIQECHICLKLPYLNFYVLLKESIICWTLPNLSALLCVIDGNHILLDTMKCNVLLKESIICWTLPSLSALLCVIGEIIFCWILVTRSLSDVIRKNTG